MQSTVNKQVVKVQSSENLRPKEIVVGSGGNPLNVSVVGHLKSKGLKPSRVASLREPSRITKTRHLSHDLEDSSDRDFYKKYRTKLGEKALFYEKKSGINHILDRTVKAGGDQTLVDARVEAVTATFSQQSLDEIEDIDAVDKHIVWMCGDYIDDIMKHLFSLEKKYPIDPNFLSGKVNSRMRAVLMDWLVQVHFQYKFVPETLYLCNNIMDRFLSVDGEVSKSNFQLVGVTALWLACKYEEVFVPSVREFVKLSDNAFTTHQMLEMELRILAKLKFDLSCPQPCLFLRRFSKAAKADIRLHTLAKYIMELSVIEFSVVDLLPSVLAASSLALAIMILRRLSFVVAWNKTLEHYSSYNIDTIRPAVIRMAVVLARAQDNSQLRLKAIREKYSTGKKCCRISRLPELNLEIWKDRILKELQEPVQRWIDSKPSF